MTNVTIRGIDDQTIMDALEASMLTAARKKLGQDVDIDEHYSSVAAILEV